MKKAKAEGDFIGVGKGKRQRALIEGRKGAFNYSKMKRERNSTQVLKHRRSQSERGNKHLESQRK